MSVDLVILPSYEAVGELEEWSAPNIVVTQGLVNRATYIGLLRSRLTYQGQLGGLQHPVLVVCFGAPTRWCPFDGKAVAKKVGEVCKFALNRGLARRVVITFLNRTSAKVKSEFSNLPGLDMWTGEFLPLMAWADLVAVTADSLTSCNEVCSAGKPLFTIGEYACQGKVVAFFTYLEACGMVKPFTVEAMAKWSCGWSYAPLNATNDAAEIVARKLSNANPHGVKEWYRR